MAFLNSKRFPSRISEAYIFEVREILHEDLMGFYEVSIFQNLLMETKRKMKRIFVWFCGTGTKPDSQREEFKAALEDYDYTFFIPGVGTDEMRKEAQKMTTSGKSFWGKVFSFCHWSGVKYDTVTGYKEREHLVDAENFFKVLEKIEQSEQETELTIGGHSRGAAVGLTGFLAMFLAAARQDKNVKDSSPWALVSKINIIAVDPVQGSQTGSEDTNDMMGLLPEQTVDSIIKEIEQLLFQGKPVFHITVYTARFDARKEFCLDSRWQEWIDANKGSLMENQDRAELYVAGFRHSSMVCAEDEITEIYEENSPRGLMKEIIKASGSNRSDHEMYYKTLKNQEIALLKELKDGPGSQNLADRTTLSSYGSQKIALHGKSLKDVVEQAGDIPDPDYKYEGRYVFYDRHFLRANNRK